jgi:hypothetical protein
MPGLAPELKMTAIPPRVARVATAAALVALAACTDGSPGGGLPTDAGAGLYPSLAVTTGHGTATVALGLRQVPGGLAFASYQGEVTYDPRALAFQAAELPDGVFGATNLVSPGHIRFAGAALDGTAGTPLLKMRFGATGRVPKEALSVSFEEVTEAGDMADLTGQVRAGILLFQQR